MISTDEKYMKRALQIARNGIGYASPNPMVGAVIVHNDTIIGEGYHRCCGEGHAEVNAIASVRRPELLPHATIYVTLEPCSHYGKTPPCAQLLIDKGIKRVVVGCLDPFEKVSGRGVKMLCDAGIEVVTGILDNECQQLNHKFITAHTLKRPFVTLKWAQSLDGYIDNIANTPAQFSTPNTKVLTHKLRSEHDAILVGSGTVIADNPHLGCRLWHGRNPRRIIIDRKGIIPSTAQVLSSIPPETIYISSAKRYDLPFSIKKIMVSCDSQLPEILSELYNMGITSLLVEGGNKILQSFIDSGLWDVARVEVAPLTLDYNGSVKAPKCDKRPSYSQKIGENTLYFYSNDSLLPL